MTTPTAKNPLSAEQHEAIESHDRLCQSFECWRARALAAEARLQAVERMRGYTIKALGETIARVEGAIK